MVEGGSVWNLIQDIVDKWKATVSMWGKLKVIFFYLLVGRPPWPTLPGFEAVRKAAFAPYQVNLETFSLADPQALFMHCLPAFHNRDTKVGEQIFQEFGLPGEM